jgi:NAD(P)H-hydrate epimerase
MENAALGVVHAIVRRGIPHERALILCGGGNNGGDGLAIARHLHNRGCEVDVGLCTDPQKYTGDALINWRIVQAMKLGNTTVTPEWLEKALLSSIGTPRYDLVIDAIFGTGLTTPPRDPFPQIVEALVRSRILVVAVDLPSGLDCDAGTPLGPNAVRAALTVTFVARKKGFENPDSQQYTGDVEVVDIGCPREAIEQAMHEA